MKINWFIIGLALFLIGFGVIIEGSRLVAADAILPSLNYWDLSSDILLDPELQADLEVSPRQLGQIRTMRTSKAFAEKLNEKLLEMASSDRGGVQGEDVRSMALLELDGDTDELLREILEPQQMQVLRIKVLQRRFVRSYRAFSHPEVQRHCGFRVEDIENDVGDVISKFESELNTHRRKIALSILADQSLETRDHFVQFLGNVYFPNLIVRDDWSEKEIPFPVICESSGNASLIQFDSALRELVRPTPAQLDELSRINERQIATLREFGNLKRNRETILQFDTRVTDATKAEIRKCLSEKQLLTVFRYRALSEYNASPKQTFSRVEFLDYLQIPANERVALLERVHDAEASLIQKSRELNRSAFATLCLKIPDPAKVKMQAVFKGVWE